MKKLNISLAIIIIGIILGLTFGATDRAKQGDGKASSASKKQSFIVIYKPGLAWLAGKPTSEQPLKEHFQYLVGLYKSGILRMAGPFEDNTGGAAVFDVSGPDEAKNLADHDPSVMSRVFIYEMHPWRFVQWEQYAK